jgi:hypothetical protein
MEPFNLEQFKAGRKAITRDGIVAEFLAYHEALIEGPLVALLSGCCYLYHDDGRRSRELPYPCSLLHMAPAEHGIEGMPWDLPAPPAPPAGMKWEYRGVGWISSADHVIASFRKGNHVWTQDTELRKQGYLLRYAVDAHYLEAVPIAQPEVPIHICGDPSSPCDMECMESYYRSVKPEPDPYAELKKAHASGKKLQVKVANQGWCDVDPSGPCWCGEYRIKPETFPPAPEGTAWHNPENLTPEQVGVSEGWRLLLEDERVYQQDQCFENRHWLGTCNYEHGKMNRRLTYRTKRPLPTPPKRVPLEAEDIPAVCWVRLAGTCYMVTTVMPSSGVEIGGQSMSFRHLQRVGYEYSADRKNWKPCSKEAK